jgi:hypothetical protein
MSRRAGSTVTRGWYLLTHLTMSRGMTLEGSSSWSAPGKVRTLAGRLAEVAASVEHLPPAAAAGWLAEHVDPKEARDLLMVALLIINANRHVLRD